MERALETTMAALGDTVARATVLLLVALALATVLRRRSAALRHQLWSGALVLLLALPLASRLLPPLGLSLIAPAPGGITPATLVPPPPPAPPAWLAPPWAPAAAPVTVPAVEAARPRVHPAPPVPGRPLRWAVAAIAVAWLLGAAVTAQRTLRARRAAARWRAGTTPADPVIWPVVDGVEVREGDGIELPMTVGALRPVVLVPAIEGRRWTPAWRAAVLAHEAAHVRRGDPWLQALAEVACVLYWFHPLVWLAARQLRTERELAADDDVLRAGVPASDYAELLMALGSLPVAAPRTGAVLPLLTPAGLKARLLGIIDDQRRRGLSRAARLTLGVAGLGLFVPTASAVLVAGGPPRIGPGTVLLCARDHQTRRPVAGAEVDVWDGTMLADRVATGADGCVRWMREGPRTGEFVAYVRQGPRAGRKGILPGQYGTPLPASIDVGPARAIAGSVRDEQGQPLAGAIARVVSSERWAQGPGPDAAAVADARGRFRLEGLLYGRYRMLFESPSGGFTTVLVRLDDTDIDDLEAIIPRTTPVWGYLQDERGHPVAGARVEELRGPPDQAGGRRLRGRHVDWDVSAADGSFRLASLARTLRATGRDGEGRPLMASFQDWADGRRVRLAPGAWEGGRPASPRTVVMRPAAMVGGTLRHGDGRRAAGVGVAGTYMTDTHHPRLIENLAETRTDEQGRFWLGPFPLGTVAVVAIDQPAGRTTSSLSGVNAEVTAADGAYPHLELPLQPDWKRVSPWR